MYEISTLGQEIRVNRELRGFSQEELAHRLGVARTTLSSWEQNKALPGPGNIRKLIQRRVLTVDRAKTLLANAHRGYPVGKYTYRIRLSLPKQLLNEGVRFGLLYMRPGPRHDLMSRDAINLKHMFEPDPEGADTILSTIIRRPDNTGFQFKCFADLGGLSWKVAKAALEERGYQGDGHPGDGDAGRFWFLLPDFPVVETPEGFRDNFFLPS